MPFKSSRLSVTTLFFLIIFATISLAEIPPDKLLQLETAAIDGNVEAQSRLASMYYLGEGVEQNHSQAFAWYQLAAEQGDSVAQYSLGNLYLLGEGVKANQEQAVYWYQLAAEQGHPKAKSRLSALLSEERSTQETTVISDENRYAGAPIREQEGITETDQTQAATKQKTAQKTNDKEANLFGQLFGTDQTTTEQSTVKIQDKSKEMPAAIEPGVTRKKTDKDKDVSEPNSLSSLQPGPIVNKEAEEKTQYQPITEQNPLLFGLYQQAGQGDAEAQYLIGNAFYQGKEVEQNFEQAFLWFRRSAEHGNANAQYSLGNVYLMGEGTEQSDEQALYWYGQAATQNHPQAKHNYESLRSLNTNTSQSNRANQYVEVETESLAQTDTESTAEQDYQQGMKYSIGDGVDRDYKKAFDAFNRAASAGHVRAQYQLAIAYAFGEGVEKNINESFQWFYKSAFGGDLLAQRQLASMYWTGNGTEQDKIQSAAWYHIVSKQGNDMDLRRLQEVQSELSGEQVIEAESTAASLSSQIGSL